MLLCLWLLRVLDHSSAAASSASVPGPSVAPRKEPPRRFGVESGMNIDRKQGAGQIAEMFYAIDVGNALVMR